MTELWTDVDQEPPKQYFTTIFLFIGVGLFLYGLYLMLKDIIPIIQIPVIPIFCRYLIIGGIFISVSLSKLSL